MRLRMILQHQAVSGRGYLFMAQPMPPPSRGGMAPAPLAGPLPPHRPWRAQAGLASFSAALACLMREQTLGKSFSHSVWGRKRLPV